MTNPAFFQLHFLTTYPASLLNRDDAGFAKRLPFGGVSRTRVSSQCLKKHWRSFEGKGAFREIDVGRSIRSRHTFKNCLAQPLLEEGHDGESIRIVLKAMQKVLLGSSKKAKKKKEASAEEGANQETDFSDLETGQIIVLGQPEIDYLKQVARDFLMDTEAKDLGKKVEKFFKEKENKKNFEALRVAAGLEAALFGRMVTSDVLARGDAAVHVAHTFTVHGEEAESDYFSAVDDLVAATGELGSAHIGEVELTSGVFYGYLVVDINLLIRNLAGDKELAGQVLSRLPRIVATVSPGAKLGSTAPYAYADFVLAEAGNAQPRSLANAFLNPVSLKSNQGVVREAIDKLTEKLKKFDSVYSTGEERKCVSLESLSPEHNLSESSIEEMSHWAAGLCGE